MCSNLFVGWIRADIIQLFQTIGTWLLGVIGAFFIYRQTEVMKRQSEIQSRQAELSLEISNNNEIINWCKNAFRSAGNAGGMLQSVGTSLRDRFPNSVPLILMAYEQLRNQEPGLNMPTTVKFVELMNMLSEEERKHWPTIAEYWKKPRI